MTIKFILLILSVALIFLLSVEKLSNHLRFFAEKIIKSSTQRLINFWTFFVSSFISTIVVQTSGITTTIFMNLASEGNLAVAPLLGSIIGANIGTTSTAWFASTPLFIIGPLITLFAFILDKKYQHSHYIKVVLYFGLILSTLFVISEIIKLHNSVLAGIFTHNGFSALGVFISSLLITILFQSSSVVTSIVAILAQSFIIPLPMAFIAVIASNIGSTSTVLIESLPSNKFGKRYALLHFGFNIVGMIVFLPMVAYISSFFSQHFSIYAVAMFHTFFNIVTGIIFFAGLSIYKLFACKKGF